MNCGKKILTQVEKYNESWIKQNRNKKNRTEFNGSRKTKQNNESLMKQQKYKRHNRNRKNNTMAIKKQVKQNAREMEIKTTSWTEHNSNRINTI